MNGGDGTEIQASDKIVSNPDDDNVDDESEYVEQTKMPFNFDFGKFQNKRDKSDIERERRQEEMRVHDMHKRTI